jgi:hypothetical protein
MLFGNGTNNTLTDWAMPDNISGGALTAAGRPLPGWRAISPLSDAGIAGKHPASSMN